jgi:uncharacterized iron-regulated membrane protein
MTKISPVGDRLLTPDSPIQRFYRTVWRWHFYTGLLITPILLILATTGIIYLFKPQLDTLMYHNQLFVQPMEASLPYTQQVDAVQRIYPNATISKVTPSVAPNRSTEVELRTAEEQTLMVFVNPYTGQVLGDRDENNNLQANARKLHAELMMGKTGDYLVELAACWGLVSLITGLYLWLPRRRFALAGTLIPRLWSRNQRTVWRDLHVVPGFYGVLLIGFLILTGLPWSGFWGETFAQVWNRYPAQMWDQVPKSTVLTGSLNQSGAQTVPWAVEQLPMPQSDHTQHQGQAHTPAATQPMSGIPAGTPVNLDMIIAFAKAQGAPAGFSVSLPEGEAGVYTVSAFPNDPTQQITLHIDQYSGKTLADVRWQNYGLVPKAVEAGIAIHMGKMFGLGNQLLMLFACLILILLSVSGVVMWWQRRPTGQLGVPNLPEHMSSWKVPLAIVAVLGLAFPLVGFSLVFVLLLDYFVLSRIPVLKRIFH